MVTHRLFGCLRVTGRKSDQNAVTFHKRLGGDAEEVQLSYRISNHLSHTIRSAPHRSTPTHPGDEDTVQPIGPLRPRHNNPASVPGWQPRGRNLPPASP